jgi:DNA repair exonuclease SbcCD ATPase subunit
MTKQRGQIRAAAHRPHEPLSAEAAHEVLGRAEQLVSALRTLIREGNGMRNDMEHTLKRAREDAASGLEKHMNREVQAGIKQLSEKLERYNNELQASINTLFAEIEKGRDDFNATADASRDRISGGLMALAGIKDPDEAMALIAKTFTTYVLSDLRAASEDRPIRPSALLEYVLQAKGGHAPVPNLDRST